MLASVYALPVAGQMGLVAGKAICFLPSFSSADL